MGEKVKDINRQLNIIIELIAGAYICRLAYGFWHFKKYPELYVVQSAPWYLDEMLWGILAGSAVVIALVIKRCMQKKRRQK